MKIDLHLFLASGTWSGVPAGALRVTCRFSWGFVRWKAAVLRRDSAQGRADAPMVGPLKLRLEPEPSLSPQGFFRTTSSSSLL